MWSKLKNGNKSYKEEEEEIPRRKISIPCGIFANQVLGRNAYNFSSAHTHFPFCPFICATTFRLISRRPTRELAGCRKFMVKRPFPDPIHIDIQAVLGPPSSCRYSSPPSYYYKITLLLLLFMLRSVLSLPELLQRHPNLAAAAFISYHAGHYSKHL